MPKLFVPAKYCRICFNAIERCNDGLAVYDASLFTA
jgi:hypothetical protein